MIKWIRRIEQEVNDVTACVGDVISFTLNDGENVEALAVKQEQDCMVFVLVDCLHESYCMHMNDSYIVGYDESGLRKTLNSEIVDRFPDEIREKMVAFENGDLLRLPTELEIFGENRFSEAEDTIVSKWKPMQEDRNRIAFRGSDTGILEWFWLQNKDAHSTYSFVCVSHTGELNIRYAYIPLGVRPVFKLK